MSEVRPADQNLELFEKGCRPNNSISLAGRRLCSRAGRGRKALAISCRWESPPARVGAARRLRNEVWVSFVAGLRHRLGLQLPSAAPLQATGRAPRFGDAMWPR